MIKKTIKKICIWILKKIEDKKTDFIQENNCNYKKIPVKNIIINNSFKSEISKDIYIFSISEQINPFVKSCVKSYKDYNPSFNVNLINISKKDFLTNELVLKILEENKISLENKELIESKFNLIWNRFKFEWIYKYGGIWCNNNTFCCRNLCKLTSNTNFIMCKYDITKNIFVTDCCFGVKKGFDKKIDNIIYPPINTFTCDYDSMKLAFYRGTLDRNMLNIKNEKMHSYIYDFV